MRKLLYKIAGGILVVVFTTISLAEDETTVYLSKEEALKKIFSSTDKIVEHKIKLNDEKKKEVEKRAKYKFNENEFTVFVAIKDNKITGYAIITEEIGKYKPITFIVGVDEDVKITGIHIMVYRESRGGEIAYPRFLKQFKGRSLSDSIMVKRDIDYVTGATLSCRAICNGTRKVLSVVEIFKKEIDENVLKNKKDDSSNIREHRDLKLVHNNNEKFLSRSIYVMGTILRIDIYNKDENFAEQIIEKAFSKAKHLDDLLSNYKSRSEISQINKNAGKNGTVVSSETLEFIKNSIELYEKTNGFFDITVGPAIRLWGFYDGSLKIPDRNALDKLKTIVGSEKIRLNFEICEVMLEKAGMEIDTGGIGKGFAIDEMVKILRENNIEDAVIDFGGQLYLLGSPQNDEFWKVGIVDPNDTKKIFKTISVQNKSVSTSGSYEKFFEHNGEKYSHIINPKTCEAVKGLRSVTVISESATQADALSTAFFILGEEDSKEIIKNFKNIEVIFYKDGKEWAKSH